MRNKFLYFGFLSLGGILNSCGNVSSLESSQQSSDEVVKLIAAGMKTSFHQNEAFSLGDARFLAKYSSNKTSKLTLDQIVVDSSSYRPTIGEYDISLKIVNTSITFDYKVYVSQTDFDVQFIECENSYCVSYLGEDINLDLQVKAYSTSLSNFMYLDKSSYKVDLSKVDNNVEGDYPLIISYESFENTFTTTSMIKIRKNYKEKLKILAIGNSFSDDSTEYLYDIAKSYGYKNVVTGQMYVGGCTLVQHRNYAENNTPAYTYRKNSTGASNSTDNFKLEDAIADEDWDVITLQQGSPDSGVISTYNGDINYLINYVKNHATNPDVKIAWHMTWAYQANSSHASFPVYDRDQMTMYKSIVNAVKNVISQNQDISFLLPSGTAIQNARTSSKGDNLTRDGHHLTLDTGRFIAGLCYFLPITGESIDHLPTSAIPSSSSGDIEIIKDAVRGAIENPFAVTQSKYPSEVFTFDKSKYNELTLSFVNLKVNSKFEDDEMRISSDYYVSLTQDLSKEDLPAGSIIELSDEFRYQPVFWETIGKAQLKYKEYVTKEYLVIDEKWWDELSFVNFNISKIFDEKIKANELVNNPISIYVPKPITTK